MADKEYIERGAALLAITNDGCTVSNVGALMDVPAADVLKVRHGEWVQIGYDEAMDRITCSCCKEYWNFKDNDTETFNYCPACGAKMDGKDDEA